MKKWTALLCAAALLFCLAACAKEPKTERLSASDGATITETDAPEGEPVRLRIVDGAGTGTFTLAGDAPGDVFTASAGELTVYLDGKKADPAELENGMTLTVDPGYTLLETWPTLTVDPGYTLLETWPTQFAGATFRAESKSKDDCGDLCGLYLTVLEDLWTNDAALNSGVAYISVDLDDAPGSLTDGEKAAVAWIFAGRHDAQSLTMGFEELKENGYVNEAELYWKDGVLFRIAAAQGENQSVKKIVFDAEKWRSGTGAIFFNGCTAKRGKGPAWENYETGGFAIA